MGDSKRTIIVRAFDDKSKPDGIGFEMHGYGVEGESIVCRKDGKDPMPKKTPHEIVFELANESSKKLMFAEDRDDVMWVSADGTNCPARGERQPKIVWAQRVWPDRDKLTVHNQNPEEQKLKFALNFVEDGKEDRLICYDPIWDNKNGGYGLK